MTSQGSPYARFRQALRAGNPTVVAAAAAELGQLSLADALAVCLVFLVPDPLRYERAAVRWHARYCLEQRPPPTADEAALLLSALLSLPGTQRNAAARTLLELLAARGMREAQRELSTWLANREAASKGRSS